MNDEQPSVLNLDRYVPYLIAAIHNKASNAASKAYLAAFGIGIVDWRVLSQIAIEPGLRASRIVQVIGLDKAAVSRSVAIMADKGFVATHAAPGRGRQKQLTLTPVGQALHARVLDAALAREAALLADLEADERAMLAALLNRVHDNVVRMVEADPKR